MVQLFAEPETATDPRRALVTELAALLEREPQHIGALYYGARVLAGLGDHESALQWLDRLEQAGLGDELDPDDFGSLAETVAFRQRAIRFAAAAPPIGQSQSAREIAAHDNLPEGTAWDPRRRELLISSGRRRTILAVDDAGRVRDVVPPADGGILAVLGMTVDPVTDRLWAATSAAPFMQNTQPGEETGARLACVDLAQGRVVQSFFLAGPVVLNDLTLALDGSVYVTESNAGTVYRLRPGGESLQAVLPTGTFEGANGIVSLGEDLLVADFHGLWLVCNPAGPQPRVLRLTTPGAIYLGGIDGLAVAERAVIAVQNLVGRTRIWSLIIDREQGRVASADVLLRGHPDFLNPTTGVVAEGSFHFIADPKLQRALPDGSISPLPAGRTGHRLLTVKLNPKE